MAKVNYQVVRIATRLIYEKGLSSLAFTELARLSEVPETTLRRHFNHAKTAIWEAVLEQASNMIESEFKAKITKEKLNLETADSKKLILLYVQMVLGLARGPIKEMPQIDEDNLKIWQTRLLFNGGERTIPAYTKDEVKPEVKSGINILDNIILRSCGGNQNQALSIRCIIFGTLTEYTNAQSNQSSNQTVNYDVTSLLKQLDIFLTSIFISQQISHSKLEAEGISIELLRRLSSELKSGAEAIDRALEERK